MRWALTNAACVLAVHAMAQSPVTAWADSLQAYWDRIDAEYRDPQHSPLRPEDRAHFTELERFAPDARFRVMAAFKPKAGKPFGMTTTTGRLPQYQPVAQLRFTVAGKRERLTVFRSIDLARKPGYEDYLFVPFTDLTNGEETYAGGRYLDLRAPLGKWVELDFNGPTTPIAPTAAGIPAPFRPWRIIWRCGSRPA